MTYQSDRMTLNCIQILLKGNCNDIYVCQDEKSDTKSRYVVLVVKDHDTIRKFIRICADSKKNADDFLVHHFSDKGQYVLVFPYVKRRPLIDFYVGDALSLNESEKVCQELVLSCIQSALPFPLLYLVIKASQINLNRDLSVYLSYELDLSELDESRTEKDCVVECARILLSLFESKMKQKAISYTLLRKKISSYGYSKFTELYKDITIAAADKKRLNIVLQLRRLWENSKDGIFKLLLVLCVILMFVALLSLISLIMFGDIPWLRILFNNFKMIGTESLV